MDVKEKIEIDLGRVRLNTAETSRVAGSATAEIDRLLTRGDIRLGADEVGAPAPGRGRSRMFTVFQVAQIRLTKRLMTPNSLAVASKIAEAARKFWEQPGGTESEEGYSRWLILAPIEGWKDDFWAKRVQVIHGVGVALVMHRDQAPSARDGRNAAIAAIEPDFPVMTLNLDKFIQSTLAEIKSIIQER
jgi:hypothetical protein